MARGQRGWGDDNSLSAHEFRDADRSSFPGGADGGLRPFRIKYDDHTPVWALTELLELGRLCRLCGGPRNDLATQIATSCDVPASNKPEGHRTPRRYAEMRRRRDPMTAAAIEPEPVPLVRDQAGRLMVPGTRMSLDILVAEFK